MRNSPFRSAFLATLLVFAALNGVSYFVRSRHVMPWQLYRIERIGFPWLMWQDPGPPNWGFATLSLGADGYFDYGALALNGSLALAAAVLAGLVATLPFKPAGPAKPTASEKSAGIEAGGPPQFSLRSLLAATAGVAAGLAFQRVATLETRFFSLMAIYVLGPWILVCFAWAARGRKQAEQRIIALSVLAMLVAAALAIGTRFDRGDFTRVLLSLYVYWVPQCVAMLAVHRAWQVAKPLRLRRQNSVC